MIRFCALAILLGMMASPVAASDNPLAFFTTNSPIQKEARVRAERTTAAGSASRAGMGTAAAEITRLADQMGVPRGLALSVCRVESRCSYGLVGRQGERGPLQIKLQTARGLGYTGGAAGLNGQQGAYWGMRHLAAAYKICGNARGAARLHQAGLAAGCGGSRYASRVMAGI
jgi:soluble lytic murein transglycosylase-like protein